jgi:hypothetical protein
MLLHSFVALSMLFLSIPLSFLSVVASNISLMAQGEKRTKGAALPINNCSSSSSKVAADESGRTGKKEEQEAEASGKSLQSNRVDRWREK